MQHLQKTGGWGVLLLTSSLPGSPFRLPGVTTFRRGDVPTVRHLDALFCRSLHQECFTTLVQSKGPTLFLKIAGCIPTLPKMVRPRPLFGGEHAGQLIAAKTIPATAASSDSPTLRPSNGFLPPDVRTCRRSDVQTWRRSDLPTFRRPCLFLPDVFYLSRFHGQRQQRSKPTRGATERLPGAHSAQHRPQSDRVELSLARAVQRFSRPGHVAAHAHPSRLARRAPSIFVRVHSGTLRRSHHISRLAHGLFGADRRAASRLWQLFPAAANRRARNGVPQAEPALLLGHRRLALRFDRRVPGRPG